MFENVLRSKYLSQIICENVFDWITVIISEKNVNIVKNKENNRKLRCELFLQVKYWSFIIAMQPMQPWRLESAATNGQNNGSSRPTWRHLG